MNKKLLIIFIFCFGILQAQNNPDLKRTWHWYFGSNAGLDFSTGTAVPVFDGQSNHGGPCPSISDTSGNLLFYSDGLTIWNKIHQVINSSSTLSDHSSESALIIPQPDNDQIYYFFYNGSDSSGFKYCIYYSIIDVSLNGGLGGLVSKDNILLNDSATRKIAAIKHGNNNDIWIITMICHTNQFNAYLLTVGGLNTANPVISHAGHIEESYLRPLKPSPDGTKLAAGFVMYNYKNDLEIFDFDKISGIVSNAIAFHKCNLPPPYACDGNSVEFSPDGKNLYYTVHNTVNTQTPPAINYLYQIDISSGDSTQIAHSKILIDSTIVTSTINYLYGGTFAIQLASDKKIYLTKESKPFIGVINNPNLSGLACGVVDSAVYLDNGSGTIFCAGTFPMFMNSFLPQDKPDFINENKITPNYLNIYPNPFSNTATVEITENNISINTINLEVYDLTGKEYNIDYSVLSNSDNCISLLISKGTLASGMYKLKIEINKNIYSQTFITIN